MRVRRCGGIQRRRVRLRRAALAMIVGALVGCRSGEEWSYDRPRVTAAQLDRDLTQCSQQARPSGPLAFPSLTGPDRAALNACMQKRGYTVIRRAPD
jgi:hypothetical protein